MWELLKTAITGVKDALGIEIPELPLDVGSIDVGSIGEAADVGSIGEAATTAVQDVSESATAAVDSAAQGLPGGSDVLSGRGR
jgi:hypothetical protein